MSKPKLLIIGSVPHNNKPETFGGTTILMQNLVDFLKSNKSRKYKLIQANKFLKKGSSLTNFFHVLLNVIIKLPFYDILMVNVSINGAFIIAPILFLYSKLLRKKFVFRMFGGNLIELLNTQNKILVRIFNYTVMNSDLFFVETIKIKKILSTVNTNLAWFPNSRKLRTIPVNNYVYNKRFVFISHVKEEKGITEIIKAFNNLDSSYIVDIYGPEKDNVLQSMKLPKNLNYRGVLNPENVIETINKYDVLLLPTFWEGEGYPGIIIEAFSQGKPVISTRWNSIPEIVNDKLGFLIEPKNHIELKNAITSFNKNNYQDYSKNALLQFNKFNSEIVNIKVVKDIYNLK